MEVIVHVPLQNFIVGLDSFWNLTAPSIGLGVFLVGIVLFGTARRPAASCIALGLSAVGVVAFLLACAVDGVRTVHDVDALGSAVHSRYGLVLGDAEVVALLDSSDPRRGELAGRPVTTYRVVDIALHGRTVAVGLDRLPDGSFALSSHGRELPRGR